VSCDVCKRLDLIKAGFANGEKERKMEALFDGKTKQEEEENIGGRNAEVTDRD